MNERLAELAIGLRSLWKARVHVMRCRKTGVFALNVGDVPSEENIESSRCIDGCELASASCFSSHDFKLLETIVETQPQEGEPLALLPRTGKGPQVSYLMPAFFEVCCDQSVTFR